MAWTRETSGNKEGKMPDLLFKIVMTFLVVTGFLLSIGLMLSVWKQGG